MRTTPLSTLLLAVALPAGLLGCGADRDAGDPPAVDGSGERIPGNGKFDVFGEDDRVELHELADGSPELELARATGALLLDADALVEREPGQWGPPEGAEQLGPKRGLCDDEPFWDQPTISSCSAVLVDEDLVATAGHCVRYRACSQLRVAFDYGYYEAPSDPSAIRVSSDQIYDCAEIVRQGETSCSDDWAVIRLDRPVTDREPVAYRRAGEPEVDEPLLAIGTPSGIPLKVATGRLRGGTEEVLHTDLDIFGGNSGSPVFNGRTGELEGIHVCSEPGNYQRDPERDCRIPLQCGENGETCSSWARATRITRISGILDELTGEAPDGGVPSLDGAVPMDAAVATDGGVSSDAGAVDAGTRYGGSVDGGEDAGPADGGTTDAGTPSDGILRARTDETRVIPDDDENGVVSDLTVSGPGTISEVRVTVRVDHDFMPDLVISLAKDYGDEVELLRSDYSTRRSLTRSFVLHDFDGERAADVYSLRVADVAPADTGTLESWRIEVDTE